MLIRKADTRRVQGLLTIMLPNGLYWKEKKRRGYFFFIQYWKEWGCEGEPHVGDEYNMEMEGYWKEFGEGMEYGEKSEGGGGGIMTVR